MSNAHETDRPNPLATSVSRRTIAISGAWTIPTIVTATAAPAIAASSGDPDAPYPTTFDYQYGDVGFTGADASEDGTSNFTIYYFRFYNPYVTNAGTGGNIKDGNDFQYSGTPQTIADTNQPATLTVSVTFPDFPDTPPSFTSFETLSDSGSTSPTNTATSTLSANQIYGWNQGGSTQKFVFHEYSGPVDVTGSVRVTLTPTISYVGVDGVHRTLVGRPSSTTFTTPTS